MIPLLPLLPRPTQTQFYGAVLWHNANMELGLLIGLKCMWVLGVGETQVPEK